MAVSARPCTVSFGEFTADLRLKELRRDGVRLKLPGQPFAVLTMLVERPGEVVTREELRAHLWRQETFVDFDHSLNVAVNRIREVLCDSKARPRFIETVPRIGYRFIAEVQVAEISPFPKPSVDDTPAHGQKPSSSSIVEPEIVLPEKISRAVKPPKAGVRWYAVAVFLLAIGSAAFYFGRGIFRHPVPTPEQKIMLAVLPFENLTGDPANEYLSDGLTEEMITQLAELQPQRLGVIARTSVMSYKRSDKGVQRVAAQLGVQYVLEGSLRGTTGRTRITAQLIQVKDQTHIWAQEYDRSPGDVLTVEREVAGDVAQAIQLKLTPEREASLAQARPMDPVAHELYLKGRFYWNQRTNEGYKKSLEYFQGAIQKDSNYAEAYTGLADAYRFLMAAYPPDEVMPKARAAAEKALAIDPNLAEAHASLGLILPFFDWDWEGARKQFERAIALNPNYATAHHWYAESYLSPMGQMDESVAEMRVAQRLDPLSPIIATDLGKTLFFARRYDEAAAQLRSAVNIDSNFALAYGWLREVYEETRNYPQAVQVLEKEKVYLDQIEYMTVQAGLSAGDGHTEQARQWVAQALKLARTQHVDPGLIAAAYIHIGDKDQAFAWLEKAYAERSNFMSSLRVWALYDPLRADPRFVDLERRVKLVP